MNSNNTSSLQNVVNNTDNKKLQSQNDIFHYTLNFEGILINVQEVKKNQPSNSTVKTLDCPNTEENVNNSIKKIKTPPDPEKLKKIRANLDKILQTDCPVNGLQGVTYPVSKKKREPRINNLEEYKAAVLNEGKLQKICTNLNKILQYDCISQSTLKNQFSETELDNILLNEISDIKKLDAVLNQHSENDFDEIDKYLTEESLSIPKPKSHNTNVYECSSSNDSGTSSIDYAITADSAKAVTVTLNFDQTESEIPETPVPRIKTFVPKPEFKKYFARKRQIKVVKLKTKKIQQVIKTEPKTVTVKVKSEPEPAINKTDSNKFERLDCNVGKISVKPTSVLVPPERKFPVVGVQKRPRSIKDSGKKPNVKVLKTEPKSSKSELIMCTEVVGNVQRLTVKTVDMLNSLCDKDEIAKAQDRKSSLRSRNTKNNIAKC